MSEVAVLNIDGKASDKMKVPEGIFTDRVNTDVIHQAVVMYQASLRQGTVSVKGRGEISGGGIKPFRQKGTGRARAGSSRSPLWAGGGQTFGPKPRDFSFSIPRKVRQAALRESLSAKYQEGHLVVINDMTSPMQKTKEFVKVLTTLGLKGKILAMLDGCDQSIERVSRNIAHVYIIRSQDVTAYDILKHKKILVTKSALNQILERIA